MSVKLDSSLKVIYNSLTLSRLFYLFSIFLLPFSLFRPVFLPLPSIVIPLLLSILGLIFRISVYILEQAGCYSSYYFLFYLFLFKTFWVLLPPFIFMKNGLSYIASLLLISRSLKVLYLMIDSLHHFHFLFFSTALFLFNCNMFV